MALFQRPYLQALYLNQGYNFFAPESVPSTLLAFEEEREDRTADRRRIDDPSIQPRLVYHRHLPLTEHLEIARVDLQENWYIFYAQHFAISTEGVLFA